MIGKYLVAEEKVLAREINKLRKKEKRSFYVFEELEDSFPNVKEGSILNDTDAVGSWEIAVVNVGDSDYIITAYCGGGYKHELFWLEDEYESDSIIASKILALIGVKKIYIAIE